MDGYIAKILTYCNLMQLVTIFVLGTMVAFPAQSDTLRDWRTGVAVGADPNGDYAAVTIARNWFPVHRDLSWGVRTYAELGRFDYDGDSGTAVAVAVEPVVTWRGFYAGIGPRLGNTTPNLGTVINFSMTGGYDHEFRGGWRVGGFINHASHCARCGFAEDKENGGVTTLNAQLTIPLERLFDW